MDKYHPIFTKYKLKICTLVSSTMDSYNKVPIVLDLITKKNSTQIFVYGTCLTHEPRPSHPFQFYVKENEKHY